MSLKSPRSIAFLFVVALAIAVLGAACGVSESRSPVGPSSPTAGPFAVADGSARSTTSDSNEGGAGENDEGEEGEEPTPTPAPAPAPTPGPNPGPGAGPNPAPPPSPWTPGTDPGPFPAPPRTTPGQRGPIYWTPSSHKLVQLKINPDPVPFSGVTVPLASCRELAHTWYYEQVIHAQTGIPFRLTERENYFDGRLVSRSQENISVEGNGTHRLNSRWCSAFGSEHTAQHRFKGKDEQGNDIIVNGPLVKLQANPNYVPPPPPPAAPASQSRRANPLLVWGD